MKHFSGCRNTVLAAVLLAPLWSACGETASTDYSQAAVEQSGEECITPKAAYKKLVAGKNVVLLDVRYLWERLAAGYPDGDKIGGPAPFIPFWFPLPIVGFPSPTVANEGFLDDVRDRFGSKDLVITFCRDGTRGRLAAMALNDDPSTPPAIYMCGGFDGDKKDALGHRTCNGWKNTALDDDDDDSDDDGRRYQGRRHRHDDDSDDDDSDNDDDDCRTDDKTLPYSQF